MNDSIVTLEFTQIELRVVLGIMNHAFQKGGLGTGDVLLAAPIVQKLNEKIVKEAPEQTLEETPPTSNEDNKN